MRRSENRPRHETDMRDGPGWQMLRAHLLAQASTDEQKRRLSDRRDGDVWIGALVVLAALVGIGIWFVIGGPR